MSKSITPRSTVDEPGNINIAQLVATLSYFAPQSAGVVEYLQHHLFPLSFKSGDLLLKAGEVCDKIYFIRKGVVRGFVREGTKDITTWISCDNELVTSISGLDLESPSFENIQVIEDCDLLAIMNKDMTELYERFPDANLTGRKLVQHYYRDAEKRALIARLSKAENKYRFFLDQYSHLANRIQLRYIASYLGITIETLSRVRNKMSRTADKPANPTID